MKKILLGLSVALAASFSANAVTNAFSCVPEPGNISLSENSGGVGSIEISTTGEINRNCPFPAVLSYKGKPIKAIPASNTRMVYCVDGFDKVTTGTPHISFYSTANSPATQPGKYSVSIPSNYFLVNGTPNTPLFYEFTVTGVALDLSYEPANNSVIQELNQIKVTFENCSRVQYIAKTNQDGTKTGIYMDLSDPNDDEAVNVVDCTNVSVDGNVATITFEPFSSNGSIRVNFAAGVFKFQNNDGVTGNTPESYLLYTFGTNNIEGYKAYPEPGTMTDFLPYEQAIIHETYYDSAQNYYFELTLPEGLTPLCNGTNRKYGIQLEQNLGTNNYVKYFSMKRNDEADGIIFYISGSLDDDGNFENDGNLNLAPGTYYVVIPAKTFKTKDAAGNESLVGIDMKFGPYVIEGEPVTYTVSPETTVEELSEITLTFPAGTNVTVGKTDWFTLENPVDFLQYDFKAETSGNVITISINPPITTDGEYFLTCTNNAVKVDNKPMNVEAKFNVLRSIIKEVSIINNGVPAQLTFVEDSDEFGPHWSVSVETEYAEDDEASLTFELPYGYDSVYAMDLNSQIGGDGPVRYYIPSAELEDAGYKKLENNTLSGLKIGQNAYGFTYCKDGDCLEPTMLMINVAKSIVSGVNEVEVAGEVAEYYTLQGVKVANPEKGVYIKVAGGKASKVVL